MLSKLKKVNIYRKAFQKFIMKNITKEEITTLVAEQLKEMELSGIFNEDTLGKIQEKVSSRISSEDYHTPFLCSHTTYSCDLDRCLTRQSTRPIQH